MKCVVCGAEFEIGRAKNKLTCSPACARRHYNSRSNEQKKAPKLIKAVGEWDGIALPPRAALRLGL
jgi:hypothetical protein